MASKLGSYRAADRRLSSARSEVLPQRNLFAAKGSFEEGKIEAKCRGSKDADVYDMSAGERLVAGQGVQWQCQQRHELATLA